MNDVINAGEVLSDRYRILKQLGHGGFGRTYLAEDINRFNEHCVLKEFAPQIQGSYVLQKAEELFEREAGVLHQLQHPQIPHFRELFRVQQQGKGRLFLVQDYIEGQTYRALLRTRQQQGLTFNEPEIIQLFSHVLPVLQYIHAMGVIHRDISPDNLMLRSSDGMPVLIDFGGVKQVAATVESQFTQPGQPLPVATRLGKVGYAPDEQMQRGIVYPHSDLYALAATALVLLTGKEPQQLIDPHTLDWNWQPYISLSPKLEGILTRMLSRLPGNRFQSAIEVLQSLNGTAVPSQVSSAATQVPPAPATIPSATPEATVAVGAIPPPIPQPLPTTPSPMAPKANKGGLGLFGKISLAVGSMAIAGVIGWFAGNAWIETHLGQNPSNPDSDSSDIPVTDDSEPNPDLDLPTQEQQRKAQLRQRRLSLGINYDFYVDLVNERFWNEYTSQRGRVLTSTVADEEWRKRWDETATDVLEELAFLSPRARRGLGTYDQGQRERWKQQVNQLRLSSRALYDIADAQFFHRFPNQQGQDFINEPIGQVWNAVVYDTLQTLQSGENFERIVFPEGAIGDSVSGTLQPGDGQAYIAGLGANQVMEVTLEAESNALFSLYSPTGEYKLLEDSTERRWSGTLPEKGFYEFVIVSQADSPINYQLTLTVEDPPSEEPEPTESEVEKP